MKKQLVFILFLLSSTNLFSTDLFIGGYAGINLGWFSGNDWDKKIEYYKDNYKNASNIFEGGFQAAVFLETAFSESFAIQPEIQFLVSSGGYEASDSGYYSEYTESVKSLFLPLLFKYKMTAGKGKLSLFAGPALAVVLFNVVGEDNNTVNGVNLNYIGKYAPESRLGHGFAFGTGYERPFGKGKIITDIRYSKLFVSYFNNENTISNSVNINIGYGWDF